MAHFITEHRAKCMVIKPEEQNKKTYKLVCGKLVGKVFHDPKVEMDFDAFDRAGRLVKGYLAMVNLYQSIGWENTQEDIRAAAAWGAKAVFIDPITNFTNGMSPGEANTMLQGMAQILSEMAADLDIVIFVFCHLKSADGTIGKESRAKLYKEGKYLNLGYCAHERGGSIDSNQFAGSRGMMRSCHMMIGLLGNKDEDLREINPALENYRALQILEDREFSSSGIFPIQWSERSGLFSEC